MKTYLDYFKELCKYPHKSGNHEAIRFYFEKFAKENNLNSQVDLHNNILLSTKPFDKIDKDNCIILQAHSDMVAVSTDAKDMEIEPIIWQEKDGFLSAVGTSLGADDGIGCAYILSILSDEKFKNSNIIGLFTSDEETTMNGANNINADWLCAKYLINLDSENEGEVTVSSAGGVNINTSINLAQVKEEKEGIMAEIHLSGLRGGHSGNDIDKQRISAASVILSILGNISSKYKIYLFNIDTGRIHNVISSKGLLKILLDKNEDYEKFRADMSQIIDEVKARYFKNEEDAHISCRYIRGSFDLDERTSEYIKRSCYCVDIKKLVNIISLYPQGVLEKKDGNVSVSNNLGICYIDLASDTLILSSFLRSNLAERLIHYKNRICSDISESKLYKCTLTCSSTGEYAPWQERKSSKLLQIAQDTYNNFTGKALKVVQVHAGLECGTFATKNPQLDIISIGPDIKSVHTVGEKADIKSCNRTYEFLKDLIINLQKEG